MTTSGISEALARLHDAGVTVWVEGDRLGVRPMSKVPPDLVPTIRENKAEIIEALRGVGAAMVTPSRIPGDRLAVAAVLMTMEPTSEEEAAYVRRLTGDGWSRRDLVDLLNRDTERRWRR